MDLEKFTARLTCTGTRFFSLLTMVSKISADILEHTACCKIMVEKVEVRKFEKRNWRRASALEEYINLLAKPFYII
ncbi:MAG: hypothetical protein WBE34_04325 [Candidatus Nitrosopolaris sp.]